MCDLNGSNLSLIIQSHLMSLTRETQPCPCPLSLDLTSAFTATIQTKAAQEDLRTYVKFTKLISVLLLLFSKDFQGQDYHCKCTHSKDYYVFLPKDCLCLPLDSFLCGPLLEREVMPSTPRGTFKVTLFAVVVGQSVCDVC